MPVLCQLANPDTYQVSTWNLMDNEEDAAYWLALFAGFPDRSDRYLLEDGLAGPDFSRRWLAFATEYAERLEMIRVEAERTGRLYTIDLCRFRWDMLDRHGFPDPCAGVKQRENDVAVTLYPEVVQRVDALAGRPRWELLLKGILAGNMFDLGSPETMAMYQRGEADFFSFLEYVPARPWFIDHADVLLSGLNGGARWRQVLIFVDNSGADIVLGVLPLARELGRQGLRVALAANRTPALNDITIGELRPLLERVAGMDPVLSDLLTSGRLVGIDSGNSYPSIDLSRVSEECDAAAAESDLIVLEGMGRAIESNWDASFKCDVWRVAMLKDESVVRWRGAKLYDAVCRFEAPIIP